MQQQHGTLTDNNTLNSSNLFTEQEREYFLKNIFLGGKDNMDSSFLYRGKGAELFHELAESNYSSHYTAEKNLLQNHRQEVHKFIGKSVTDFGCGDGEKANLLLTGIGKPFQYIAADYSSEMIRVAENKMNSNRNATIGQNFLLNGRKFTLGKEIADNTYLRLGETMSNLSDFRIVENLKDMGNTSYTKGNNILFSFALKPKDEQAKEERIKIYDNPLAKEFVMNGIEQLGLDRKDFSYTVIQDNNGLIIVGILAKKDGQIEVGGRTIKISTGGFYPIHQNRTFSKEDVNSLLKQAKCDKKFFAQENGVGLMLVQKMPEKWEKYGSKVRNTVLGLLLLGSGFGIKTGVDMSKIKREINTAKSELVKDKNPRNYGINMGSTADFGDSKKALLERVQQQSNSMYDDMLLIYANSDISDKQSILYLLQSELLNKQSDGQYIDFPLLEKDSAYRLAFLQSFLKSYRVVLANFGLNLLQPYADITNHKKDFGETLGIDGEIKGIMGTIGNRSMPTERGCFVANQENTTMFEREPLPEHLQSILSDSTRKDDLLQKRLDEATYNFEQYKNEFPLQRDIGYYRHSDGRLFQTILVNKSVYMPKGKYKEYSIILAADVTSEEKQNTPAKLFSLSNGKEVIKDIQTNWLNTENTIYSENIK